MNDGSRHVKRRRAVMRGLIGIPVTLLFGGCSRGPGYHAIDVSRGDFQPTFDLPDAEGRPRRLADFRGKAVLVFFGFTRCPNICPTALARAAKVRELLGKDADRLQVIFVSVDPGQDTAAILHEYVASFDRSFIALRGSEEETSATAKAFKVFYQRVPLETGGYTMDHTALSYAFDPNGRLHLVVGPDLTAAQVAEDLRRVLAG